jgi:methionyl-tRNA formyltransferase
VAAGPAGVDVAAGDGQLVRLLVLQAEGGKRLGAAEFLAGRPLATGMAFDLP